MGLKKMTNIHLVTLQIDKLMIDFWRLFFMVLYEKAFFDQLWAKRWSIVPFYLRSRIFLKYPWGSLISFD